MTSSDPWIHWLGGHPESYFWLAGSLVIGAAFIAVRPLWRGTADGTQHHDWRWGAMILAIMLAGRWPTFVFTRELNPDESQMLAGAHVLARDPVFWRAVDGHTAGPLDFLVLCPAGQLLGWDAYLPARCTAVLLIALALTLLHQCLALTVGRQVARVTTLGAVTFEALTNSANLLHYSTELMPVALLAGAAYAAIRRWVHAGGAGWNLLGGLLLGAVPLAKPQAVPLAAVLGLGWLAAEWAIRTGEGLRPKVWLVAGALLPAALFAAQVTLVADWADVVIPFYRYNLIYSGQETLSPGQVLLADLRYFATEDSLMHLWLGGSLVWMLLMVRRRQSPARATRLLVPIALAACGLSIWITLYPGRPYIHYWQFTVLPITLLTGALSGSLLTAPAAPWSQARCRLVALCALILVGLLLGQRAWNTNRLMRTVEYRQLFPSTALAARITAHTRPGEAIAIWGWSSHVYVETGLRQATRAGVVTRLIDPSPYKQFYRDRYLADLQKNRPEWFLDSVGPNSTQYVSREFEHERQFPELAAVVRRDYVLAEQIDDARLYRRRDLPGR
jgi:hypothetical protein